MKYSTIAYAKLNLDYDRKVFEKEYDKFILPNSRPICNSVSTVEITASLNSIWKMVPDELYTKVYAGVFDEEGNYEIQTENRLPSWLMEQLKYVKPEVLDEKTRKASMDGYCGGTALRNTQFHQEWHFKPEYEHLQIVKFIKTLPFKRTVSVHCVSLEPGQFAGIHRDSKGLSSEGNTNVHNDLARRGYVALVLNISDGGGPLYWSLDGDERFTPMMANEPAYMISDYFLHGVPLMTSRRRQIRVTGIPNEDFAKLLDMSTAVVIPRNYNYQYNLMGS